MPTATLTSKGQITIPQEVRRALGLETGDRIEFVPEGPGRYAVIPATQDVRSLKGLVPAGRTPVTLEEMERVIRRRSQR